MTKFGLLTCIGSPLTVPLIEAMEKLQLKSFVIIVDGKASQRDMDIDKERLDPNFPFLDLPDLHLSNPTYFVKNHNSAPSVELIKKLGIDFLVNAGTPRILKKDLLDATRGVINCHPGILPKYRGCTCLEWSVHNGDPVGASAHLMSEKIDSGPVLQTEVLKVAAGEDYKKVRTKMLYHQANLLAQVMQTLTRDPKIHEIFPEGEEQYHKPMPQDLIEEVKKKMASGKYTSN